jgi:enoyl-CoA hydratase/carnithine racemase
MSWTITREGRVAVVTMNTNPVNAQNRAFFADLHEAFDTLEAEHPESPVVLTGQPGRFSAGLDLDEHFRLYATGSEEKVRDWFADYRATNMRLFTYPRPTVAAVNGHAFAGGLITSAVCDRRVVATGDARFAINEVPIGIAMPAVYLRMLQYAWGEQPASMICLQGEVFGVDEALARGVMHEAVPADRLEERAVEIADLISDDNLENYAFTKRALQAPALRDIAQLSDELDERLPAHMTSEASQRAQRTYWEQLKGRPADW